MAQLRGRFIPRRLGRGLAPASRTPRRPVHPQAAGEREGSGSHAITSDGSSPGGWGEAGRRDPDMGLRRFIPRRLGRGPAERTASRPPTVHPQAAGERARYADRGRHVVGSSPGGWGEAAAVEVAVRGARFIPRRLGRGRGRPCPTRPSPVHPQAAGERMGRRASSRSSSGSSPGGWGEGHRARCCRPRRRFIPRRLGRGRRGGPRRSTPAVHPQAAGERGRAGRLWRA